jgi:hypothetical protein
MDNGIITAKDTIFEIVSSFPVLRKTLVDISKRFEKLNNPLLFNTVAKLTTVEKASKMGNVYLNEMLYQLNEAVGKGDEFLRAVKARGAKAQGTFLKERFSAPTARPRPDWMDRASTFETLDVREMTGEPFFEVTKRTSTLGPGGGLVLIQRFEPAPLISHHESQGFETFTERVSDDEFRIHFYRPAPAERKVQ